MLTVTVAEHCVRLGAITVFPLLLRLLPADSPRLGGEATVMTCVV
eukprot:SAG22_NODE_20290_length_267_cov_0.571429_1_plen_44_part_01